MLNPMSHPGGPRLKFLTKLEHTVAGRRGRSQVVPRHTSVRGKPATKRMGSPFCLWLCSPQPVPSSVLTPPSSSHTQHLSLSIWGAITNTTDWVVETRDTYFSRLRRLGVQEQGAGGSSVWREPSSWSADDQRGTFPSRGGDQSQPTFF